MTDRVRQMLDVVRNDFQGATKHPRGRRARAIFRAKIKTDNRLGISADAREGILRNPVRNQEVDSVSLRGSGIDANYSGPSKPDEWRSPEMKAMCAESPRSEQRGGLKIDPADAAMAAFQAAKLGSLDSKFSHRESLQSKFGRVESKRGIFRSKAKAEKRQMQSKGSHAFSDSDNGSEDEEIVAPKRRGSWIKALKR